jgi:glutamate dehydrogenase
VAVPGRSVDPKADLFAKASSRASSKKGTGAPTKDAAEQFLRQYYRHIAVEDLTERAEADVWGAAVSHHRLAASRLAGVAHVRAFTPSVAEHGWSAGGHTVVEVVTDDMPFLVDSVTMELHAQSRSVHLVIHPQLLVRRTVTGELVEVIDDESYVVGSEPDVRRESWMHVEIDRETDEDRLDHLVERLCSVLSDVREAVEDWGKMHQQVLDVVEDLRTRPSTSIPQFEVEQGIELLSWLADDHFTLLGYREYRLGEVDGDEVLRAVPGTGLGILRADQPMSPDYGKMPPLVREKARDKTLLVLAKANSKSTVHRPVYLDYIGVKTFDADGEVVGERRFLGLYSSAAYTESLTRIPLLREKAYGVLEAAGVERESHTGKALMDVLENYPRDELFQTPLDELQSIAMQVLQTRERRRLRLFVRRDAYHRFLSCLVYLPRDRYNTAVREKVSAILLEELGGSSIEYTARVSESMLARVHFVVRPDRGEIIETDFDVSKIEKKLMDAARSWADDFVAAVRDEYGEGRGAALARKYADSWPEAYKEDYAPQTGAADIGELEAIEGEDGIGLSFYRPPDCSDREARLKVYRIGSPLSLSKVLPILSSMGVEVVDEWPYTLLDLDRETHIYDFGLRHTRTVPWEARSLVQDALAAVWDSRNEADGFNALVIDAGLDWRQVTVLRAYAKYMRQGGTPFAQDYIESALLNNRDITRLLLRLFESRFDPGFEDDREQAAEQTEREIGRAMDDVVSLDQDRILRSYLTAIKATLRTNFFQHDEGGRPKPYISFKLDPGAIPELPEPRPKYEIFVYSPRVEGVHLRFGDVARGGLRWSDRRDDFRTEVLGLVKAQMVKNTVIVPVGAKGGFFPKQLPDPSADREAWMEEGKVCYRTFICGLLDLTDNLVDGEAVTPQDVVRHDGDDTYLVVAADKGTATFSDIANGISQDYGFWLGDAFASGGSVGYDHKAMGITARGAWESVRRHFREMGVDCQEEDFTCVGVGDMSGDVFGNGMLLSRHIKLVAAFDHRDVFLDPDPDPETSYEERKRLFEESRSSWHDYDESLISEGGGVWSRTSKKVPISEQVRAALGIEDEVTSMAPQELIRTILLADVDLLWNGGIGTYVKASTEAHGDVGDKANDAIRVDGARLRVKVVGEGGNLGLTQLGRIEYAREGCGGKGGRINTDFIDNSAGVDTSDHEVNIKILLDRVVRDGDLTEKQRNKLLREMTEEVGDLVLRDNYEQNIALSTATMQAASLTHVHEDWMQRLEREGRLDRELEFMPSSEDMAARIERGEGLSAPELAVLLAYTKIVLAEELVETGLPDDPFLQIDLREYFPPLMRERYAEQIDAHPLRREIVVTSVVNELINGAGITFHHRLSSETGASAEELVRANFVAREIFGSRPFFADVYAYDNKIAASSQLTMRLLMRTLVERATRWLLHNRRAPLDSAATVEQFRGMVGDLMKQMPTLVIGRQRELFEQWRDGMLDAGVPEELAERAAVLPLCAPLLGLVEVAQAGDYEPELVARTHLRLGERLHISALSERIHALPRQDRWQTMARAALRDDIQSVHAGLTAQVLEREGLPEDTSDDAVDTLLDHWAEEEGAVVERATTTLAEICDDERGDLARMSVGLRVVRTLLA